MLARREALAGQDWYETTLDKRFKVLSPEHTIMGIGNYGYDWPEGDAAETISFQHAAVTAQESEAAHRL